MAALEIELLVKTFDGVTAVDQLDFSVREGEIFGFLGGNGAGKTTTLRMVLDIIRPTSGRITVLGSSPDRRQSEKIGFLPEERGLYAGMSAIDTIVYFGRLKGMSTAQARGRGLDLLERFDLADRAKSDIGAMSKGMAQKVQLATALVNEPELLMLDEPFSGLDPVNQELLEDEILRASARGATVIFSTHVMQHAERLCERLLLLRKGRKRFEGTLEEARDQLPTRLEAVSRADLAGLPGIASAERGEDRGEGWHVWRLELAAGNRAGNLLEYCTTNGIALRGWDERRASLHEVFVHMVGKEGEQP